MPRYAVGQPVRVMLAHPPGHVRTPYYIRGLAGTIERVCGEYPNPEELAYGRAGTPPLTLYRVRFKQSDVWPDYKGGAHDTIDIEIYSHWLTEVGGTSNGQ